MIEYKEDAIQEFYGSQLYNAPQLPLTTANSSAFTSDEGSISDDGITILDNMRTRINELETRLKNLGLLQ